MKSLSRIALALGLAVVGGPRAAAQAQPRTEVVFVHPESFTDIKDYYNPTDKGEEAILRRIRNFLVRDTERLVPEGYKLTLNFTDIDLAGDFEPWRGIKWQDIRIYTENYPPTFKFTYSITDSSGRVVRQGTETLRGSGYLLHEPLDSMDTLRYDKDVLNTWARQTLKGLPKA
jgi:hypothetical protein